MPIRARAFSCFPGWKGESPPEDIDRLLIVLDVFEEEVGKVKSQCDEALKLIKTLKSQW